ncbi:MAG TPA: metallophosphoesterase [Candidatus Paceibacterota bacterium]
MISTKMLLGILVFAGFIGLIILSGKMYAVAFRLSPAWSKAAMASGLLVLGGFILGMTMGRSAQSLHPTLYSAINIIAGFGFYLFLGGLALSVVMLGFSLAKTALPLFIPITFLSISLLLGITGLIQSRSFVTVEYSVTLANLPQEWNGVRAVLVSDTHFGLVNHAKFSDKVINNILTLNPDLVLHAGDFYDGPRVETAPITVSWKRLAEKIPVFYAPGNHETYGDYEMFVNSVRNAGVTVLDNRMVEHKGVQIAGLTYYGTNAESKTAANSALENLSLDKNKTAILINHPPTSLAEAENAGVNLMVSGHTHNGQFWPMTYVVRPIYGAYYYGLNLFNTMQVLTTSGVGTFGPPFRTFNSPELVVITFKTQ